MSSNGGTSIRHKRLFKERKAQEISYTSPICLFKPFLLAFKYSLDSVHISQRTCFFSFNLYRTFSLEHAMAQGILNGAFLALTLIPLASEFFPKKYEASTSVRVAAGMTQPGEGSKSTGGNVPNLALFDPNGDRLGFMSGETGGKIGDGKYQDIKIPHLDPHNNRPAEYMSVSASGTDALCIAYLGKHIANSLGRILLTPIRNHMGRRVKLQILRRHWPTMQQTMVCIQPPGIAASKSELQTCLLLGRPAGFRQLRPSCWRKFSCHGL